MVCWKPEIRILPFPYPSRPLRSKLAIGSAGESPTDMLALQWLVSVDHDNALDWSTLRERISPPSWHERHQGAGPECDSMWKCDRCRHRDTHWRKIPMPDEYRCSTHRWQHITKTSGQYNAQVDMWHAPLWLPVPPWPEAPQALVCPHGLWTLGT